MTVEYLMLLAGAMILAAAFIRGAGVASAPVPVRVHRKPGETRD
jgi:hypothetical protein